MEAIVTEVNKCKAKDCGNHECEYHKLRCGGGYFTPKLHIAQSYGLITVSCKRFIFKIRK